MDSMAHSLVNILIYALSIVDLPIVKCLDFFNFFVNVTGFEKTRLSHTIINI